MKLSSKFLSVVSIFMVLGFAGQQSYANAYSDALAEFKKSPTVSKFLAKSYGYALYPTVGKGGFGIGGAHGKGKVFRGGSALGSSKLTQLSIGFQMGGQAFSQLIVFQNKAALDRFIKGNFEFSAQAAAIAITANASAQTGTTGNSASASSTNGADKASAEFSNGMIVFTVAKGGLMYEASIGGQKFSYKANK